MKRDYRTEGGLVFIENLLSDLAKRRTNDFAHARACGRDRRFAGHRNWREYNNPFLDSDDPAETVARRERCIELLVGRASHGDGRGGIPGASWLEYRDLQTRVPALQDVVASQMVPFNVGRERPDRADARATRLRQLFFCAGIEACDRTIYSSGRGRAARNRACRCDFA